MARIKLVLPKKFQFTTRIRIRVSDINFGGHLGNDSVLSIIHEARARFLNSLGFTELNIDGLGIIISDVLINYKSEGFYGEILKIEVATGDHNRYGCDFFYKLTNDSTGREVARSKTGIVFFDYENKKIALVPEVFKNLFPDA